MDIIEQLKSINFENAEPNDILNILHSVTLPTISSEVIKGTYILRTRKGDGYTKRSQMTYCPIRLCTSIQRATLAGQTMFYGVISDDQAHLENARAISISECSKLTREGKKSIGREKFTISYWEVIKPLNVVSFIADTTFSEVQNNKLLNNLRDAFKRSSFTNQEKDLIRFISNEFSKDVINNKEYLISATISSDIINNPEKATDGIIFPSVQLGGQAGLNIALSTKAVNSKLRFKRTIGHTLYKNRDKCLIRMEKVTENKGKTIFFNQFDNEIILNELNINSLKELPFII